MADSKNIITLGIGAAPGGLIWFFTGGLESGVPVPPFVDAVYVITVPAQDRSVIVAAQDRAVTVAAQDRSITVPAQPPVSVAAQSRAIVVRKPIL
jgi:hypothetical protein